MTDRTGPLAARDAVTIMIEDARWIEALPEVEALCRRATAAVLDETAEAGMAEVAILLTDDAALRDLNRRFRGIDRPTNVLSFPDDTEAPAGDIAVAYDTVAGEAAAQGKSIADHLVHLVVHGNLHLAGYDHVGDTDAAVMERLEVAILDRLGVGDPYAALDERR